MGPPTSQAQLPGVVPSSPISERRGDEPSETPTSGLASAQALPRTFGRYVLFDLVGRGGMAEIFLARARTTGLGGARLVVVKQILPELSSNRRFSEAFVHEAKLAARLSHANVVQVIDLGREGDRDEGRLFIAMEYVEGLDLNELLRRCARARVPLPIEFALLVVLETLRGLDYAHRRTDDAGKPLAIVHRDVSPSNVLLSVEGEVKLCDFGIARAFTPNEANGATVASEAIQGKAGYMSPEHARGEAVDARADVFAVGVILWELLSGRRLYKVDKSRPEVTLLSLAREARVPPIVARGLPFEEELHGIVMRALRVARDERYPSAAAMIAALQAYVGRARMVASPLRLGDWLTSHFGAELVEARRARERAVSALESAPPPSSSGGVSAVPASAPLSSSTPIDLLSPPSSATSPRLPSTESRGAVPSPSTQSSPRPRSTPPPPAVGFTPHASPFVSQWPPAAPPARSTAASRAWLIVIAILALAALVGVAWWIAQR